MIEYEKRNEILKKLGYASYAEYLRGPRWRRIKDQVHKRDKNRCRVCGEPSQDVHHLQYDEDTLKGVTLANLIALCGVCHNLCESDPTIGKTTLAQANKRLQTLLECDKTTPSRPGERILQCETCGDDYLPKRGKRFRRVCIKCFLESEQKRRAKEHEQKRRAKRMKWSSE